MLPTCMEASARCVTLDSLHNPVRLHTSVLSQSTLFRWGSSYCSKQQLRGFCSTAGSLLTPPQGCDRGGPFFGCESQLLQSLFPCSEKGQSLFFFQQLLILKLKNVTSKIQVCYFILFNIVVLITPCNVFSTLTIFHVTSFFFMFPVTEPFRLMLTRKK